MTVNDMIFFQSLTLQLGITENKINSLENEVNNANQLIAKHSDDVEMSQQEFNQQRNALGAMSDALREEKVGGRDSILPNYFLLINVEIYHDTTGP